MAKLIKKAAIFLIPFVLLFLLLFLFEPFDYFGLRNDATYLSKPLSSMRELMRDEPPNIILGDSRMANLNVPYIEELTGEQYTMLGFGGATLGECSELFWFATEHTKLEKVVFGVSFYTAGGDLSTGRIPLVEKQATSTYAFISNFNNWLEAINTVKYKTKNLVAEKLNKPELLEIPENPATFDLVAVDETRGEQYRKNLEDYAAIIKGQLGDDWHINPEAYTQLQEIIDYCNANEIELIFVFPPMQESLSTLVIEPLGIQGEIDTYKQFLQERATVYDFEFVNEFTKDESNFYDGFHLAGPQKKVLAQLIFQDIESETVKRYNKA